MASRKNNPDKQLEWNKISDYSSTTKAYFAKWDRLNIVNGVLYKIWESANGINKSYQLIAPRNLHQRLYKKVHDSRFAEHMGRRRTMHALLHFCYWRKMSNDVSFWISSYANVKEGSQRNLTRRHQCASSWRAK